jgi:hypothetical protein
MLRCAYKRTRGERARPELKRMEPGLTLLTALKDVRKIFRKIRENFQENVHDGRVCNDNIHGRSEFAVSRIFDNSVSQRSQRGGARAAGACAAVRALPWQSDWCASRTLPPDTSTKRQQVHLKANALAGASCS